MSSTIPDIRRATVSPVKRLPFAFENLAPPTAPRREAAIVSRELRALANLVNPDADRKKPKALGACEAIGHRLPTLPGFGEPVHDRSNPGRANLALYTPERLSRHVSFVDLLETWPRTERRGTHPPRSLLLTDLEDWLVILGHAPPIGRGTSEAREEWLDAMVTLLRHPTRPVIALTDPNGLGGVLARLTGSVSGGTNIEAVHARNVVLDLVLTPNAVNGVPILSDHHRCLLGKARRIVR